MAPLDALSRRGLSYASALLWALLCATVGAGCDAADYSDLATLEVTSTTGLLSPDGAYETTRVFALSEVGRASIDYVLRAGDAASSLQLAAQMQTSGDSDAAACEALSVAAVTQLTPSIEAIATAASADNDLLTFDRAFGVSAPATASDAEFRFLRFRPTGTGVVSINLFVSPATAQPQLIVDGEEVLPSLIRGTDAACVAQGGVVYRYEVEAAKLHLLGWSAATLRADQPRILLQIACETNRSVPSTCAGHVALPTATVPRTLAAGASETGHISTGLLGIGDRIVLALRCRPAAGTTTCDGTSDVVVRFEPVECKSAADCNASQSCSSDGYCVGETACSTGGLPSRGWLLAGALVLSLAARRRRTLGAAGAAVLLLAAPMNATAAVPQGTEVFAEIGAGSRLFVGSFYDLAGAGGSIYERQGLQFGPWGGRVTLAADYTLTNQPAPPFQPSLQTLAISLGAQRRFEFSGLDFEAGADITRLGVLANPLVAYTGPATNFVGFNTEFRWLWINRSQQHLALGTQLSGFFDRSGFRPAVALTVGLGFRATP